MKKLLFFLLLSGFASGQSNFSKLDSIGFKNQVETILKSTGKTFEFYKFKKVEGTKIIAYKNTSDNEDVVSFYYYTFMDGEDKNLEKKGTEVWSFKSIIAKYLTLFPIWKTFADPNADMEKLSKMRSKLISKEPSFSISELEAPTWMMRF